MIINLLLIACAAGIVQHFIYDFLGHPKLLAPFLPVSESVWEHFKLVFYPLCGVLIYIGSFAGVSRDVLLLACAAATLHSALVMFGLFYLYFSGFGVNKPIIFFDISIFFISIISGYFLGLRLLRLQPMPILGGVSSLILGAMLIFIIVFSYNPPKMPLFTEY